MATDTSISEIDHPTSSPPPVNYEDGRASGGSRNTLLDYVIIIASHKRLIFRITAAMTVLAAAVAFLLPKGYTAMTVVLPPQQSSSLSTMLSSQLGSMGLGSMASLAGSSLGLKNPNDRYVGMLRSRVVEDAVIQQFGLQKEYDEKYLSDTRKKFETNSEVDGSSKDGLIHISVEDRDPRRAAEIANGYVAAFKHLSDNLAIGEASQRRVFYEQQLEQAKDNLANAEEALKKTEETTGLIELDSQASALIQSVATLRAQITAREVMLRGMQTYATGENSEVVQAQQELESLRAQLAKLGGSEENKDQLIIPKGLVPQAGLEYVRKLRDVKYYETIFEVLARQYELAKLDEAKEGAMVQVVDSAVAPDKRSSPKRARIIIGAFLAGLFISIVVAFAREGWQRLQDDPVSAIKLDDLRDRLKWRSTVG